MGSSGARLLTVLTRAPQRRVRQRLLHGWEGGRMAQFLRHGRQVAALVAVVVLSATACSKSSTPTTATYDVFAQKFRYHGMPASVSGGDMQINFSNKESFPIVHEMILAAMPAGKTA